MNNPDAVDITLFHAEASSTLQHDDNSFVDHPCSHGGTNALDELARRCWSIPPPAGRTRPDHVRRVDEKQFHSLSAGFRLSAQLIKSYDFTKGVAVGILANKPLTEIAASFGW